jgi:hypothetical protein
MQVKVWNDNDYDYKETFKDNEVKIPAKSFIEMEYYDAHEFKGTYKAIQRDGDNQPLPHSYKKIWVEEPPKDSVDAKIESNTCAACKFRGGTPKELLEHIVANHAHQAVVDEEAEKAIKSRKKTA